MIDLTLTVGIIIGVFLCLTLLGFVLAFNDYLDDRKDKQCHHICRMCQYRKECDWYNSRIE